MSYVSKITADAYANKCGSAEWEYVDVILHFILLANINLKTITTIYEGELDTILQLFLYIRYVYPAVTEFTPKLCVSHYSATSLTA